MASGQGGGVTLGEPIGVYCHTAWRRRWDPKCARSQETSTLASYTLLD